MAIHINLSEEAEAELKKASLRNRVSAIGVCLACMTLGALALYFTVIALEVPSQASFIPYIPPADDAPPTNAPTVKQLTARASSPSSSVAPNVIVSSAPSAVAMADVDVPVADADFGVSNDIDLGMGAGLGDGLGEGGTGLGTTAGGGSALEGVFFDLKQTPNGASTGNEAAQVVEILYNLTKVKSSAPWAQSKTLSKFYKSPTKLYASVFMMPSCSADYAPVAYQCADKVKPKGWVAIYRGKVKAPKSGKFRFVGTGDDTLIVRFNNKVVLESGWAIPSEFPTYKGAAHVLGGIQGGQKQKDYHQSLISRSKDPVTFYTYPEIPKWNRELGGLKAGDTFDVKEGNTYPVEVLISEIPGGYFGFALMIEDLTDPNAKKASNGKPLLQIFRTNFNTPTKAELESQLGRYKGGEVEIPPYDQDSLIWVAVP